MFVLEPERRTDVRGHFARTFCVDEYRAHGIDPRVAQCSLSHNPSVGTLRGIHLQRDPHGETKSVRCVRGAVFDVAVDLRSGSATFGQHHAAQLSAENGRAMVIPPGVAHGFLTIEPDTDLWYQMSVAHVAEAATGVRWDDPELGIAWPIVGDVVVSERDLALPNLGGAARR